MSVEKERIVKSSFFKCGHDLHSNIPRSEDKEGDEIRDSVILLIEKIDWNGELFLSLYSYCPTRW